MREFDNLTQAQKDRAFELGFNGFFALTSREHAEESLEYARRVGDEQGIMLSMAVLQNRNAVDTAINGG